ncbi:TonB-dependent siderophore receptor [Gilvimarinus chinensis]|uniref:TonB-dependent siderophore receptor n=1 Tax=Gilvimarinus chinensis TaxID=396005 RepID=UPI00036CFB36|nr:TonB-dependent siderophore receptor [Gilvimarinus chinensis]
MGNHTKKALTAALFALSTTCFASESTLQKTSIIEELYVVGEGEGAYRAADTSSFTLNGLPLSDTPMSVQSIPVAILNEQAADSLQEALRNVSGVQPAFTMGGAYERFTVRGFANNVASYRNGVLQPMYRFFRANTESVQVLKGPAALELGMSDPGGAINVITRAPAAEPDMQLSQSVGSLDEVSSVLNATGALGNSGIAARLDASWRSYGGFRDVTDSTEYLIAPSFTVGFSERTSLRVNLEVSNAEYIYDQGLHAWGDGLIDLPRETSYAQGDAYQNFDSSTAELVLDHVFNNDWRMQLGFSSSSSETYFRSIYATGNPSPGNTIVRRSAWFGPEAADYQSMWASVNGQFTTGAVRHNLTFGVQDFSYDFDAKASITFIEEIDILTYQAGDSYINVAEFDSFPQDDAITQQNDRTTGFYLQDQMYLTDQLIVLAGLRYDSASRELHTSYFSPVEHYQRDDDKTTGRLGVMYKFDNGFSPYVSYSTSFGPGFNYLPSALYDPETASQLEVGFKSDWVNDKVSVTASLFELSKENIPTADPEIPNRTVAIGEAQSHGLELDIVGELSPAWSLLANLALTETEITRDYKGAEGNKLPNAPDTQAGLWLRYSSHRLALGGGPVYVSERFGTTDNSYQDDSYTRWDAFVSYGFNMGGTPVETRLTLNNITNERYYTLRSRWSNMPSEPFNAVASINVDF